MKPINGKAMTREERNARRRELDKNPFHHALSRKTAKKWRDAHKDELNARRRQKYAENPEKERARLKKWREGHKDSIRRSWKKWASRNKLKLKLRDAQRYQDPEYARKKAERRKELMKDPARRERVRIQKRMYYHSRKFSPAGIAWKVKYLLEPRWIRLLDEPVDIQERYRRRCTVETWSLFVKWARQRGRYFDPQKCPDRKGANGGRM